MKETVNIGFIGNPNCGKTTLFNAYTGARLKVATEIYCEDKLLVKGYVVLVSINPERKIIRLPEFVLEACKKLQINED